MYRQGDILLVPVPFTDLSTNKRRPVLVISNDDYNNITEDVIVAAITSNLTDKKYAVIITNEDLESGNLKVTSCIRADKIFTISQTIVMNKFGTVKKHVIDAVKSKIRELIE